MIWKGFLIENINSIDDWWNSKEVQDAKNLFCQKYSTHSKVVGKESLSVIYR